MVPLTVPAVGVVTGCPKGIAFRDGIIPAGHPSCSNYEWLLALQYDSVTGEDNTTTDPPSLPIVSAYQLFTPDNPGINTHYRETTTQTHKLWPFLMWSPFSVLTDYAQFPAHKVNALSDHSGVFVLLNSEYPAAR